MAKANKLQKEIQMIEIDVQKLQLQMNIDWEPITMENQVKVKLYDQLIEEGLVELEEALEKVEVGFRRWHFEQVKNYFSALDQCFGCGISMNSTK